MNFNYDSINIDAAVEVQRITASIKEALKIRLKKRGAVVGISGGLDSSVVLALTIKAVGADKVIGVMMPEKDSTSDSLLLASQLGEHYGVKTYLEDISGILEAFGCYNKRDEAVKRIFPEYNRNWKLKIVLPRKDEEKRKLNLFYLTVVSPEGESYTARLPLYEYLQIVAASNFKQRSRMAMLYYYAELENYAVIGTANKNEREQGFFVKYGDGGSDINPIGHLFKTQVYQLAEYLQIPEDIRLRVPTTDTYSAEQTQEEFFYQVPFEIMDRVWFAMENNIGIKQTADVLNISELQAENIKDGIIQKMKATEYLRLPALEVPRIQKNLETAV